MTQPTTDETEITVTVTWPDGGVDRHTELVWKDALKLLTGLGVTAADALGGLAYPGKEMQALDTAHNVIRAYAARD